jgi:hypothetical protein
MMFNFNMMDVVPWLRDYARSPMIVLFIDNTYCFAHSNAEHGEVNEYEVIKHHKCERGIS